jgi:hypothetical protein
MCSIDIDQRAREMIATLRALQEEDSAESEDWSGPSDDDDDDDDDYDNATAADCVLSPPAVKRLPPRKAVEDGKKVLQRVRELMGGDDAFGKLMEKKRGCRTVEKKAVPAPAATSDKAPKAKKHLVVSKKKVIVEEGGPTAVVRAPTAGKRTTKATLPTPPLIPPPSKGVKKTPKSVTTTSTTKKSKRTSKAKATTLKRLAP